MNKPPKRQACRAPRCHEPSIECRDKVFMINTIYDKYYLSRKKDRIVIFRRFSVMYQTLKKFATQISFEVYAVRVVTKCKSKLSYVSSIKSWGKDTISMSHLVARIEHKSSFQNQM